MSATCDRLPGGRPGCGGPILWTVTSTGNRLPVDPEPNPAGNVAVYRDHTKTLRSRVVSAERPLETFERPAMPHFATCPRLQRQAKPDPPGVVSLSAARDRKRRRDYADRHQLEGPPDALF